MSLQRKKSIDDLWPMKHKKVLMRVDFNVPIKNGEIKNDLRIRAAIPSIQAVLSRDASVILMSHLGRPEGVKFNQVQADENYHRYFLETWAAEHGTGKTTYFSVLPREEKKQVLGWSSVANQASALSDSADSERVLLFSNLSEEEKKKVLDKLTAEHRHESRFPQLRQYQGYEDELSLRPVAVRLQEILRESDPNCPPVLFAEDCLDADRYVHELLPGQALLLENVRFYKDESSSTDEERMTMARKIASYGDYFVSDAFGTAHRNSATMTGIPSVLAHGVAGYLMAKEIEAFRSVLNDPPRPLCAVVGGAKVSDKILLLESLMTKIDTLIIGGAMAYTFLKATGHEIGRSFSQVGQSFTDKYGEQVDIVLLAKRLLDTAAEKKIEVVLPIDHVCHTKCEATDQPFVTSDADVPNDLMALDIGPKTVELFQKKMRACQAVLWNGPMGVFEIDTYSTGTFAMAACMGDMTEQSGALTIIGGGDSASAAELSGHAPRISHVSTGGGASLELLEGQELPGIAALDNAD